MPKRVLYFFIGLVMAMMLSLGACSPSATPPQATKTITSEATTAVTPQTTTLLTAAAASLQNALEEINPLFKEANKSANPLVELKYNFAASGPLQQQIEQGAPVDVFISAAAQQMDALQKKDLLLADTRKQLLTNSLVLIVPNNSTLSLTSFEQLTDANIGKISLGEPRSVPAGKYAEEVFTKLGILEELRPKFVYGNSVRNVLSAVESGNADAGIVYLTDAKISKQVKQIATADPKLHSPIVYPIAVIKASKNQESAKAYVKFLSSNPAQDVFKKYGFGITN
jgi:molybdate transport system substrate-binding protein